MDVKLVNPFLQAIQNIMPQLGFKMVNRGRLSLGEKDLHGQGVTIIVGLSEQAQGNVVYNMTRETACQIASTMMNGMPVTELDELAQSAVSELGNMLTANAATNFSTLGLNVNISSPSMIIGHDFKIKLNKEKYIVMEMIVDELKFEVSLAIET